jgi:hypothetical protein
MIPSNVIATIPRRATASAVKEPTLSIQYLSISDNPISSWNDVDSLVTWFPELYELSISFEPLASGELHTVVRVLVKIPNDELPRHSPRSHS